MPKKTTVSAEEVVEAKGLRVDVSFDDAQLAAILEADLEPAQVRNEIGLAKVKEDEMISLEEAIQRAVAKYKAVS